jgi:membrane complex biogenesis BtpA family protein
MSFTGFQKIFSNLKPLIGMVHLSSLPGSPRGDVPMANIIDLAIQDAEALNKGGMDGILVENYGDTPFFPTRVGPETVAAMTVVIREIQRCIDKPLGVNVLRNDVHAALAIATILNCDFIRANVHTGVVATDQGIIEGRAAETLRYRKALGSNVLIFADVFVKHGKTLNQTDIASAAAETVLRGLADTVIVTGGSTGESIGIQELEKVKMTVHDAPVLAGSGVTSKNLPEILKISDGIIVGTNVKIDGRTENRVDEDRVRELVDVRDRIVKGLANFLR